MADLLNQRSGWDTCTANDVYRWETGRRTPSPWLPFLIEVLGLEPFTEPGTISGTLPASPPVATIQQPALSVEDDVRRRSFLGAVLAGATPLLDLAALEHISAAVRDAHRYADHELVGHLQAVLEETARMDLRMGSHRAMPAALGILSAISSAARDAKPAIRSELLVLGSRAAEFTAWLHHDVGSPERTVGYWHGQAKEWATFTGDGAMHAYVLMRQAQALGRKDPARMLDLARAATSGPWTLPPRPRAEALQQEARGLAMTGAAAEQVARVLDRAHAALEQAEEPAGSALCTGPLGDGYTRERLLVQSAIRLREAGRPTEAIAAFQAHLSTDAFAPRDHALYSAFLAGSLADIGEPDEAAAVALDALEVAADVRSGQAISALNGAARTLFPYRQRPQVRELHERLVLLAAG